MTDTIPCPACDGKGSVGAFVDFADKRKSGFYDGIECMLCKGAAVITLQQSMWMKVGGTHRTKRVAQRESIRDCAIRLGIGPAELSAMESGRADPQRLVSDTPDDLFNAKGKSNGKD